MQDIDILVAMAPLSRAEIHLCGSLYDESLSLPLEIRLQAVATEFDHEWGPIGQMADEESRQALALTREARLSYERARFFDKWAHVIAETNTLRDRVYREVFPPILSGRERLTNKWFTSRLASYSPASKPTGARDGAEVSQQTLSRWRARGLLIYDGNGHPNFDSATAIFMMRFQRPGLIQGFLPPGAYQEEPAQFCYRRDTPDSPITVCGLPLDRNQEQIPKHALLFSPLFSLARFRPDWLEYEGWSVRWAGTVFEEGKLFWDLSEDDIALWDEGVSAYTRKILGAARMVRHTLANLVLLTHASHLITTPGYRLPVP